MKCQGRYRTPPWLALFAGLLMWTSADGARRGDCAPPRPPADPIPVETSPPPHAAHPTPELR